MRVERVYLNWIRLLQLTLFISSPLYRITLDLLSCFLCIGVECLVLVAQPLLLLASLADFPCLQLCPDLECLDLGR
ncbi:uncharacterized protein EURHEDRAFT_416333 [Aspergillus ruber CBS 135680]|uniref:Uncharacterized protein n=1 Tax=Aspergillus ruber (strain CBS 135680) TaxID=1388766 RepID=A0A017S356_ASPRC|nr:uncharacterized protein EURHEDRAFT_416333 [Aspergillus ruber CBS 135680]EYE91463.1 hypothetical protein EURHEDRAFT_416333 [Aspergillus ruber CBS 135680]